MSGTKHSSLRFDPRAQPVPAGAGPWDEAGGVVYPDNAAWDVVVGAAVMAGTERFRVVGDARIEGKLTVTGSIDPTDILIEDAAGQAAFLEMADGQNAAVSAASRGRLRYNDATGIWEASANGAVYVPLGGGGDTWDVFQSKRVNDLAQNAQHNITMDTLGAALPADCALSLQFNFHLIDQVDSAKTAGMWGGYFYKTAGVLTFGSQSNLGNYNGAGSALAISVIANAPNIRLFVDNLGGLTDALVVARGFFMTP